MKYPLEGIRVIDFSMVWAGPVLTFILGSMGAEIIKVESRKRIDSMRLGQDNVAQDIEKDPWFHNNNCSKLGITVDFTQPQGASLLKELSKMSDVVVENFAPTVLGKYGLDYESFKEVNPNIIMASLPGAGSFGPLSDLVTYGTTIIALCGYDSLVGYEGERVIGMQQAFPDANAAVHGAFAVLAALYHRRQTGEGQHIPVVGRTLTPGGCMICTGMSGSGVLTGTVVTTMARDLIRMLIRLGRTVARAACVVAAAGTPTRGTAGLPFAAASPTPVAGPVVFASCGKTSRIRSPTSHPCLGSPRKQAYPQSESRGSSGRSTVSSSSGFRPGSLRWARPIRRRTAWTTRGRFTRFRFRKAFG